MAIYRRSALGNLISFFGSLCDKGVASKWRFILHGRRLNRGGYIQGRISVLWKLINATERKIKMIVYSTRIPSLKKKLSSRTSLQMQDGQA